MLSLRLFDDEVYSILNSMRRRIAIIIGCIAAGIVLLLLNFTTPSGIGPFGVLLFLAAVYVTLVSVLYVGLSAFWATLRTIFRIQAPSKNQVSHIKLYYFSSVLALAPVILLGIQSVGGVKITDVLLVAVFEGLACLYVYKRF